MSLKQNNLITKETFQQFCKKHKININDYDLKNNHLYIYQENVDELKDKSDRFNMFLIIHFNKREIGNTIYYYNPHKDLYQSNIPDIYGYYAYKAQAELYVPIPINLLKDSELTKLFNIKEIKMRNIDVTNIPANTIGQLETLYKLFFTNLKSYNDMFKSDTFNNVKKVYLEQKEQIKQLNKNMKTFLSKKFTILKKKAELEQDFKG